MTQRQQRKKEAMTPIPTANGGVASVIEARKFGVSVEVPEGALPDGSMLSVATFAEQRIANLTESESARHGEFAFSPIVQVRAYSRDGRPLADTAASLGAPLTLVMPHAFCPSEGLGTCSREPNQTTLCLAS